MAKLKRLFWTNLKTTSSGERRVAPRDIQGQFLKLGLGRAVLTTREQ
jgi:hypothetical protein